MRDPLSEAQAFFGDKAEAYRASASHGNADDLQRMVRLLRVGPGMRALDVATGGGHTALALRSAGAEVVATDATLPMLRALADTRLPRAACDAHALPFRDASLDVVASRIAPHHFPDLPRFVREAARVLRPGGALYVFDLTSPEDDAAAAVADRIERLRDPSHVWSHRPGEWRAALAGAGLAAEALELRVSEFDLEPWVARARMPPEREAELRRLLAEHPPAVLEGYGSPSPSRMRVLRLEILARKR